MKQKLKTFVGAFTALFLVLSIHGNSAMAFTKPKLETALDLGAPSSKITKQLFTEANYLLFKNSSSVTFEENVRNTSFSSNSFPKIADDQKDLSNSEKTMLWVGNDYRNNRFYPVKNRMSATKDATVAYKATKWIKDNNGAGLDAEDQGWCAWFVRFMLRDTNVSGNNKVTYFGNRVLKSGGQNIWGRGSSGIWYQGIRQANSKKIPKYIPQAGDLVLYYRGTYKEQKIQSILTNKTHKDGTGSDDRPFDHIGLVVGVIDGTPYILEGNRGAPKCTIDEDTGKCTDKRKGWGYMRLNKGMPPTANITSFNGWVVIRPNWK